MEKEWPLLPLSEGVEQLGGGCLTDSKEEKWSFL